MNRQRVPNLSANKSWFSVFPSPQKPLIVLYVCACACVCVCEIARGGLFKWSGEISLWCRVSGLLTVYTVLLDQMSKWEVRHTHTHPRGNWMLIKDWSQQPGAVTWDYWKEVNRGVLSDNASPSQHPLARVCACVWPSPVSGYLCRSAHVSGHTYYSSCMTSANAIKSSHRVYHPES